MAEVRPGGDKDCSNSAPAPPALGVGGSEIRAQLQLWSRVMLLTRSWNFMKRENVPPSASQQLQLFSSRSSYYPLFYNPPRYERQDITTSIWCLIELGICWTKTIFYQFRDLPHIFKKTWSRTKNPPEYPCQPKTEYFLYEAVPNLPIVLPKPIPQAQSWLFL